MKKRIIEISGDGYAFERKTIYTENGTIVKKLMTIKVTVMIFYKLLLA